MLVKPNPVRDLIACRGPRSARLGLSMSKPQLGEAACWRIAMQLCAQFPANPEAAQHVLNHMRSLLNFAEGNTTAETARWT
jgi:hypothetical protein